VGAVSASPAALGSVRDPVRALQHALYRAAKAESGRRFHALADKVYRRDVLWRGWVAVRVNDGAPGIDKVTLDQVEQYGIARLLDELATELKDDSYRPLPARRVLIPKPGSAERRPLSIPHRQMAHPAAGLADRDPGHQARRVPAIDELGRKVGQVFEGAGLEREHRRARGAVVVGIGRISSHACNSASSAIARASSTPTAVLPGPRGARVRRV
jgi:hypothetical protein